MVCGFVILEVDCEGEDGGEDGHATTWLGHSVMDAVDPKLWMGVCVCVFHESQSNMPRLSYQCASRILIVLVIRMQFTRTEHVV